MAQDKQQTQDKSSIIIDDAGYNPTTDPANPAFDMTAWKQAIVKGGGMDAMLAGFIKSIEATRNELSAMLPSITRGIGAIIPALEQAGVSMLDIKTGLDDLLTGEGVDTLEMWGTLSPYMDAELDENPAIEDEPLGALIAAAARRARADGKQIPALKAEHGQVAEVDLNFPTQETTKENSPQDVPTIAAARNAGALTTLENHVATIADKLLQHCFTSRSMWQLPGDHDKFSFDVWGKLDLLSLGKEGENTLQPLDEIHTSFLMLLLRVAEMCDLREYNSKDNPNVGVYLPAIFRETGLDPRDNLQWDKTKKKARRKSAVKEIAAKNPNADEAKIKQLSEKEYKKMRARWFRDFLRPFDSRVGVIDGEGYYTVAQWLSWDERTDVAYIAIPYEVKLVELARLHADRHSAISTIFRANILTENQSAVELANRIAVGVIERGITRSQSETYKSEAPHKAIRKTTTTTAADGTKTTETLTYQPDPAPVTVTKESTDENGITTTVTRANPRPRIFRWESRFDTLIADCPQLQKEIAEIKAAQGPEETRILEAAKETGKPAKPDDIAKARKNDHKTDPQRVNKKLKDTFTAAIRIIMEKSDMPQYYAGLTIKTGKLDTFKAPTNSTLKEKLVITHKGKNPAYSK